MVNLMGKVVNCYQTFLTYLTYGITNQNYELLYDANLLLRNEITDEKFRQYFYNNLKCSSNINLNESVTVNNKVISWTLNDSDILTNLFNWSEVNVTAAQTYNINSGSTTGYYYMYLSVPKDTRILIYDELGNLLFDASDSNTDEFEPCGMIQTSYGNINTVYKKKNMFNAKNPIVFTIKIY